MSDRQIINVDALKAASDANSSRCEVWHYGSEACCVAEPPSDWTSGYMTHASLASMVFAVLLGQYGRISRPLAMPCLNLGATDRRKDKLTG